MEGMEQGYMDGQMMEQSYMGENQSDYMQRQPVEELYEQQEIYEQQELYGQQEPYEQQEPYDNL